MNSSPKWLKVKAPKISDIDKIQRFGVATICEESKCPNRSVCYSKGFVTFMLLGNVCTRICKYCNVKKSIPIKSAMLDFDKILYAIEKLKLKHVVITSVTRDDLYDGGAEYFAKIILMIKQKFNNISIETLIPDFNGNKTYIEKVVYAKPDVIGHNIDIVKSLYSSIKPGSKYRISIELLKLIKKLNRSIFTKSFIMLGFGEKFEEVVNVMKDLKEAECDILMIGQYLRPSQSNIKVAEYIQPHIFQKYASIAKQLKFKYVISAPLVRSSYNSYEFLKELRQV